MDEKQIIEQIRAGDINAFEQIVTQYQRLVSHVVFRMIDNDHDRDDLCQEIFIKVYQHLTSFKFESKLSTWIAKIAYNRCINFLEKKKVPLLDDFIGNGESGEAISYESLTPDQWTETQDISIRVQLELERMPVNYRTTLTLYHLDEMSYHEIGEIMNLPEGTVKSHLFRARAYLKKRLTAKYQQEELWQ